MLPQILTVCRRWASAPNLLLTLPLCLLPVQAMGKEHRWTHYGVRPLAMGNAYVAVADDYNALFYNPAGLARLKEWDGEFINPALEISASTVQFFTDAQKLLAGSSGDVSAVLDLLEKNAGKNHHFRFDWTPHLVFQGFGFGLGMDLAASMAFHRDISADVDFGPRAIAPFSFATNFLEDRLSIGAGVKLVARGGVDREFSINDIEAFVQEDDKTKTTDASGAKQQTELSDFVQGGWGVGADFGLLFTPIKPMSPTLGISITDIGGTPYTAIDLGAETKLGAPPARLPSVNTGISLKPYEANNMYVRASVDAASINQPMHYSKKFNLGMEWGYGSIIKVQTGLYQGELTGGFEFDVFLFSCRFATYAEQLGAIAGQDKDLSDRRYVLQLKLLI